MAGATDPRASLGTVGDGAFFAIAGDASKAATPTADMITFRFVLMFDLMCVSGSGPRDVARIPYGTRASAHHEIVLKNIVFIKT